MNDSLKTLLFALAALLMLGVAITVYYQSQPLPIDDFQLVGQPFYDQFNDAQEAQSLEVTAIDPQTATLQRFKVEQDDGLWTIPSHYDYPAEAADRLAATATSVMGLTRESLVGRVKGDHERLGVLDPLDEETLDPESAGQRISIKDSSGDVLVDLIVGKQAGERTPDPLGAFDDAPMGQDFYYVRRPDETQTYKVLLDIDLSTRFADWIRPDLLQIDPPEVRQISIDNYEMKEERSNPLAAPQLFKMQGEQLDLTRMGDVGPWNLVGFDEKTETLDSARVDELVAGLDELTIVGVRPKTLFDGLQVLTPNLKLNPQVVQRFKSNRPELQNLINQVQFELKEYGFNLAPGPQGADDLMLVSETGEMSLGTDKGVVYSVQFGKPIVGEETAIEIGVPLADGEPVRTDNPSGNAVATEVKGPDTPAGDPVDNRFLMIRVNFDESLLADKPVKPTPPVKPVPPDGYPGAVSDPNETDGTTTTDVESEKAKDNTDEDVDKTDPTFEKYKMQLTAYEEATAAYELSLTRFEDEQAEFEQRVMEGKKRVKALNERYGAWFYVIAGTNLEALQLDRQQLVQPITSEPASPLLPNNPLPQRPNINFLPETDRPQLDQPSAVPADGESSEKQDGTTAANSTSKIEPPPASLAV
ncbi:MAG: DUF4340 domain-containing protein [Mariniblastus sp.]|nr:DUF4340 domain-containing protein [Mariniblastus sp.]